MSEQPFANRDEVATHFREKLKEKKYILLFAHNGIGKTRLSMAFKDLGKKGDQRDTLYFNAYTEDLFYWDNDLENDAEMVLRMNRESRFFEGLKKLEMENRIRPFLRRYANFDFSINYKSGEVNFTREVQSGENSETVDHIKVSRGEENIFIWCFFLAVAELAIDRQEPYHWVKYIYIDDPISSLDDNNAIAVASHLAQLLKDADEEIKAVISSHHALFFNVMCNALKGKRNQYFLDRDQSQRLYMLRKTDDTPFFHHVALLRQLYEAEKSGQLYTYHFNILRSILEKTATFHGFKDFSACIKPGDDDSGGDVYARAINIFSHGNYSLFEPREMVKDNKQLFKKILDNFRANYQFNPELFPSSDGADA